MEPGRAVLSSGGITTEEEEQELEAINAWIEGEGLPRGELSWGYADPESGRQRAVFDLAWPMGVQEELSQPVAVLLNEDSDTLAIASAAGFRCFTDAKAFKRYVRREVLAADGVA